MKNTYLFYDIETTGLNKCFDQVLQFAAIRTDMDLKEIERHEIFVKLNPDVIPSPMAVIVHKIGPEKMQSGISEYEAIKKIHQLLNVPGTISIGYNTLGFDDEFLRFSFYRNLLTPYTHQYASGCSRMDIYPMAVMYYLFKPGNIVWPKIEGKISLKLENLSKDNDLMKGDAHNAMSDVEATLKLAELFKKDGAMWEYLCGCFDKKTDLKRVEKLPTIDGAYQEALLIEGNLGAVRFYQSPALGLGLHEHYKNQSLWLPLDAFDFSIVNANNIATTTFVNRKRFGEPPISLALNERFDRYLSDERRQLMAANIEWIKNNPAIFIELVDYHKNYKYPEIPNLDIDAALYQIGFMSDQDQFECNNFHAADPYEKVTLIDSFSNSNLREQAIRVVGRNYSDVLVQNDGFYREFINYLDRIKSNETIFDYKNGVRLTPERAMLEIENLQQTKNLDPLQSSLLTEISSYLGLS